MTSILSQVASLNDEAAALADMVATERTAELRRQYVAILLRHESPQTGDADRLRELLGELGITLDDAQADLKRLKKARQAVEDSRQFDARQEANAAAREALRIETERHEQEHKRLNDTCYDTSRAFSRSYEARQTIASFLKHDPWLLEGVDSADLPQPKPAPAPAALPEATEADADEAEAARLNEHYRVTRDPRYRPPAGPGVTGGITLSGH